MTSIESIILRLVATLDIIISASVPCLMGLVAIVITICAVLLTYRIIGKLDIM